MEDQISDRRNNHIKVDTVLGKHRFPLKRLLLPLVIFCLVIIGLGTLVWTRYKPASATTPTVSESELPGVVTNPSLEAKVASSLDGTLVASSLANRRPIAVMVENHPDSRPQAGLGNASVIYEAIAEGGITRFMALFGPKDAEKVGPVRSARTYYLDWALEHDAAFAHVGGNYDALELIPKLKVKDLDEFALGSQAFWRIPQPGKAIEHTMYTSTAKLREQADKKFGSDLKWTPPTFKSPVEREHRPASQSITVNFSSAQYNVLWSYDPESNQYLRTMGGSLHKDLVTGETLRADNIFVQTVKRQPTKTKIGEDGWIMTTVGEGKGLVFQDGKRIEATWKKVTANAPTQFFDAQNQPILRNPGVTWFEIVPPDSLVTSS